MVSYQPTPSGDIAVYLENRRVGTITSGEFGSGFCYVTVNGHRGEIFPSVREVQKSLEAEEF